MKNLFLLTAVIIFLASCQKEISNETGGGATAGSKLMWIGTKSGSDSTTVAYSYNTANRITSIKYSGTSGGQPIDITVDYIRNGSNTITQQVLKGDFGVPGLTQLTTDFKYDAATAQYQYSTTKVDLGGGFMVKDSTVYTYDASKKVTAITSFQDFGMGAGYEPGLKQEFTYAGNNVSMVKTFSYDNGQYVLGQTDTYEYDNKINPVQFTADAPVLGMVPYFSANNIVKVTTTGTSGNDVLSTTYTYNSGNRPETSDTGGDFSTYHYQ